MLVKNEILSIAPIKLDIKNSQKRMFGAVAGEFELKKSGKILLVDFYNLAEKKIIIRFVYDFKNFILYDYTNKEWNRKKLESNQIGYENVIESENTAKILNNAFQKQYVVQWHATSKDIIDSRIIYNYNYEQSQKKSISKQKKINKNMDLFGPYPQNIKRYMLENVFPYYIFMENVVKGKKKCICSHCGAEFEVDKTVKHKSEYECPKCHCKAIAFSKRYYVSIKNKANICIAQKGDNNILLRWAKVERYFDDKLKPHITIEDYLRQIRGKQTLCYGYKSVYPYGKAWRLYKYEENPVSYVYIDNLNDIYGDNYYNVKLKEIIRADLPIGFSTLLDNIKNEPKTEYLLKAGLVRLASSVTLYNVTFEMNKQYLPLYRQFDVSYQEYLIIDSCNTWVNIESFAKFREMMKKERYIETDKVIDTFKLMSFEKMVNYFTKQKEINPQKSHFSLMQYYKDYIAMCRQEHYDLKNKNIRYPKELVKLHDMIQKQIQDNINAEREKKFKEQIKTLYKNIKPYSTENFTIVLPQCKKDFVTEGQNLSICVGSQSSYYTNHMEGHKMVFFIRHTNEIEKSFVTIEIDMDRLAILQMSAYGNSKPKAEVRQFAEGFLKNLKKSYIGGSGECKKIIQS